VQDTIVSFQSVGAGKCPLLLSADVASELLTGVVILIFVSGEIIWPLEDRVARLACARVDAIAAGGSSLAEQARCYIVGSRYCEASAVALPVLLEKR
jgi:hypothetical protein